MEDRSPAAVAAGAEVAAPAAVAAIPVVVAEDRPATRLVTAALVPVPKPPSTFCPFDVSPPVFTSSKFLWVSAVDF